MPARPRNPRGRSLRQQGRSTSPSAQPGEEAFEKALRPRTMEEFVGQGKARENLKLYIEAVKMRGEALDHVLLSGAPGLGKTTLAGIIANELGAGFHATSGPAVERAGDLVGILSGLEAGDVFFIDEIHRIPVQVAEYLYAAMEEFAIDVVIDRGPAARSIRMPLQRFTLVGATTREGLLSGPFRGRFGIREKLDYYPPEDLVQIVRRSAAILSVPVEEAAAQKLACHARGTPRIANRFLKRARDVATVEGDGKVTPEVAMRSLGMLGVDEAGLCETDRRILKVLLDHGGAPVGLKTIAVSVSEEEDTIEEVYEPYLIRQGLLRKTPKGRVLSPKGRERLGAPRAPDQAGLF